MSINFDYRVDDEYLNTENGKQIEKLFKMQAKCKPYYCDNYPSSIANIITDTRLDYVTGDNRIVNVNTYLLLYYCISVVFRNPNRKDAINVKNYIKWLRFLRKKFYPNYAVNNHSRKFISVYGIKKSHTIIDLANFIYPSVTKDSKRLLEDMIKKIKELFEK